MIIKGDIKTLEIKRCYVKINVDMLCLRCHKKVKYDNDQYLSYPEVGDVEQLYFYCDNCDAGIYVPAKVKSCVMEFDAHFDKAVMED